MFKQEQLSAPYSKESMGTDLIQIPFFNMSNFNQDSCLFFLFQRRMYLSKKVLSS